MQLKLVGARPAREPSGRAQGALLQGVTQKVSGIKDARINHHAGLHKNANGQLRFLGSIRIGVKNLAAQPQIGRFAENQKPEFCELLIEFGDSGYITLCRYADDTSDDVPGLVAEADTAEALLAKLRVLIPELLEANGYPNGGEVPFELFSRRFDAAYRQAA